MKKLTFIGTGIIIVFLLLYVSLSFLVRAPDPNAEEGLFVISRTNQSETTKRLQESGYIRSPLSLSMARLTTFRFQEIEAGGYKISKGMDARRLISILTSEPQLKWITIP